MRWLFLLLVLLLAGLQYRLWLGEGSLPEVWALQAQLQAQKAGNQALRERNAALRAEVDNLRTGLAAMEERARSELGMIRPGETFFVLPEASTP